MPSRTRAVPRSTVERGAARRAREISARVGTELRTAREDAGLSLGRVAVASGVTKSRLHDIEAGACQPRWETIGRISSVLGLRLSVALYPGTGPLIRDHIQASMLGALLASLDPRWRARPEVPVYQPVRGVIDLVLDDPGACLAVACEAHSELRRIEQQIRWARAKAGALGALGALDGLAPSIGSGALRAGHGGHPTEPGRRVSRLLLLRSTARSRAVVAQHGELIEAAYPACASEAHAALTGGTPWPGDALLWCRVEGEHASLLDRPPRGVSVGR
jgi:transcriptional regulator with XRE-family HTH domain